MKMGNYKIPSDEEFKRASQALARRARGLSQVRDRIKNRFRDNEALYEFFIMDSSEVSFYAYIFYRRNRQIEEARVSGLESEIVNAVWEEMEGVGRGDRGMIDIQFEFDSDENVEKNYEGEYYLRLR